MPDSRTLTSIAEELASIFLNTSMVEADFSGIVWEKNDYRHSLTDVSLEGILQTKQFKTIWEI
jgi:hypothetical protein